MPVAAREETPVEHTWRSPEYDPWLENDEEAELEQQPAESTQMSWHPESDPWQQEEEKDDVSDAAPPRPRAVNDWGETICIRLLQECSLMVCQIKRHDLEEEVTVLVKCEPKSHWNHRWELFFLAAPKALLMLRGESSEAFCVRHGSSHQEAANENSDDILQISRCLHPTGYISSIFWKQIVQESWSGVCRVSVEAILCTMKLNEWQVPLMHDSLEKIQEKFRVDPNQRGFFARPDRSHRSSKQQQTYEQRQLDGNLPFEEKNKEETQNTSEGKDE